MRTRFKRKMIFLRVCLHALGAGFLAYFTYHSVTGDFGMRAGAVMQAQIMRLEHREQALFKEREYLAFQVSLMKDGTLDADMLDERARMLLSLSREDEIVIFHD